MPSPTPACAPQLLGSAPASVASPSRGRVPLFTARRWHKWAGLFAFVWLTVLGFTGWIMNHREDWNWIWQRGLPVALFPENVVTTANTGLARHLQFNPAQPKEQITAGARGAWWSADAGKTWQPAASATPLPLIVNAVEPAPGWSRVWFGTHDGVWLSTDHGRTLQPFALAGTQVTALALGASADELIGVAEKSRVFRIALHAAAAPSVTWLDLAPAAQSTTAPGTNLSRLTLDLHYGRGLFVAFWDELINDVAGLGLAALGLTGLLLWLLPLNWRKKRERHAALPSARTRKSVLVWLMGIHAKWLGPVIVLPLAWLFLTGIYIGHFTPLSKWFKATPVAQSALPPTYALRHWDDWIEAIAAYPGQPARFSLGTRTGLFTTDDLGRTWRTETGVTGGVLRLRRIGDDLLAPNGMSGSAQRLTPAGWRAVAAAGSHLDMASEVTPLADGRLLWKHGAMLHISDADGRELEGRAFKGPRAEIVPFYTVASRLHTGALFWKQWKWINDAFALAGLVLLGTGLVRWWRLVRPVPRAPAAA
jgi:uncharacterized iron-regulated membrane protein